MLISNIMGNGSGNLPDYLSGLAFLRANIFTIRKNPTNISLNNCLLDSINTHVQNLVTNKAIAIKDLSKAKNIDFLNRFLDCMDGYFRLEQDLDSTKFDLRLKGAVEFRTKVIAIGKQFKEFTIELLRNLGFDSRDQVIKDGKDSFMRSSPKLDTDIKESTDKNWDELKQGLQLILS